MFREWSAFSSKPISSTEFADVMQRLGAKVDEVHEAWRIDRDKHFVLAMVAHEDIEDLDDELLDPIRELDGDPKSRIALLFKPAYEGSEFELRMVRAIAIALAERWPIVLDDHTGQVERVRPPRGR